jgi:DNA-binding MarR family transcriptional regulator
MNAKQDLEKHVFQAAARQGMTSVLFRNAVGRTLHINPVDNECLSFLTIRGSATPKDISQYTSLSTGSTTVMLDRLEKAGYIVRKPNPKDRRGVIVEVDQKWRDKTWPLIVDMHKAHSELLASYSAEELTLIGDFLNRFSDNVRDQVTKIENGLL